MEWQRGKEEGEWKGEEGWAGRGRGGEWTEGVGRIGAAGRENAFGTIVPAPRWFWREEARFLGQGGQANPPTRARLAQMAPAAATAGNARNSIGAASAAVIVYVSGKRPVTRALGARSKIPHPSTSKRQGTLQPDTK